jgi:hypothetical protein
MEGTQVRQWMHVALAAVFAGSFVMRKFIDLALAAAFASTSAAALADSKSAAQFALNTCLAAMDGPAKVEAIAREHNWTNVPLENARGMMSLSAWEVMQSEDKFLVSVGTMMFGPPLNYCSVGFPGKNVAPDKKINRDEFFNVISASAEVTLIRENKTPRSLMQNYEIKSERVNRLMLTIVSTIDGNVMVSIFQEHPRFPPTPAIPG